MTAGHADLALALRLERAAAGIAHDCAEAHRRLFGEVSAAASLPFGSGMAAFIDEGSPLTQVKGAGMSAPNLEADLDELEAFFSEREAPLSIVLSPFADAALFTMLSRRGYEIGSLENALYLPLGPAADYPGDPDVTPAEADAPWAACLAEAFFDVVTPGGVDLARTLYHAPQSRNLGIAYEGAWLAAAQLDLRDGLAVFQCDGTLRRYREAGLQKKLIAERLRLAAEAGCDLATADVQPGSISQRNYEKMGFRVAYTRITLLKP